MWASFNGHTAVNALLLENGAAINAREVNGRTALMYASSGPFAETVELLLEKGADVNIQGTAEGFTALMTAAAEGTGGGRPCSSWLTEPIWTRGRGRRYR